MCKVHSFGGFSYKDQLSWHTANLISHSTHSHKHISYNDSQALMSRVPWRGRAGVKGCSCKWKRSTHQHTSSGEQIKREGIKLRTEVPVFGKLRVFSRVHNLEFVITVAYRAEWPNGSKLILWAILLLYMEWGKAIRGNAEVGNGVKPSKALGISQHCWHCKNEEHLLITLDVHLKDHTNHLECYFTTASLGLMAELLWWCKRLQLGQMDYLYDRSVK